MLILLKTRSMRSRALACNLILAFFVVWFTGCGSTGNKKKDKKESIVRLHLESNPLPDGSTMEVPVFRRSPVLVNMNQAFFLDESLLKDAEVVQDDQGFQVSLEFDNRGALILENATTSYRGSRVVVFGGWGEGITRWLAAPVIRQRSTNGVFLFTPDATMEEAETLVAGLKRVAEKNKKQ